MKTFTLEEVQTMLDVGGFCVDCGHEQEGVEPDARKCRCDICGMFSVYGAEEIVIMGLVK